MNIFETAINKLEQRTSLVKLFKESEKTPLNILEPIDVGAKDLLSPLLAKELTYPPLEVEYLISTLNEHIASCLEIRSKAQELEIRAFIEVNDQLLLRSILENMTDQAQIVADTSPRILGNTIDARFSDGTIQGNASATYFSDIFNLQKKQIEKRIQEADLRLAKLGEEGNGMNYFERFNFLKKLFNIDLIEAFLRARSASIGLKRVYGIDLPVPPPTNIGYLDLLILWSRDVTYKLENKVFNVRETTIAFALGNSNIDALPTILDTNQFNNGLEKRHFEFNLDSSIFSRLDINVKNPRLRGFDVHLWLPKEVLPPFFCRISVKGPVQEFDAPADSYQPAIFIPMSTYPNRTDGLAEVPNQREVHNVNPIGNWSIKIEKRSIANQAADNETVQNLIIRMRIAYERQ